MDRSIDELERDVADSRARLADAMRGIEARLTPAGLADEAFMGFQRASGRRAEPSPARSLAMLAGYAGLKFALSRVAGRRNPAPDRMNRAAPMAQKEDDMADLKKTEESVRRAARKAGDAATDAADAVREAAEDYAEDLRERGRETIDEGVRRGRRGYERVRESAAETYDEVREQAEHAAERAREGFEEAEAWAEERYREAAELGRRGYREARRFARGNPVAVGAIGLAAGLVLGALLARGGGSAPSSRGYGPTREEYDRYAAERGWRR